MFFSEKPQQRRRGRGGYGSRQGGFTVYSIWKAVGGICRVGAGIWKDANIRQFGFET